MNDFDKYKNPLPYPHEKDYQTVYYYKGGKTVHTQKAGEAIPLPEGTRGAVREVVTDEAAFKAARKAYYDKGNELITQFYTDVKEDLGIADHPKADLLMSKAWGMGHSSGMSEVYYYALDLVDLIKD